MSKSVEVAEGKLGCSVVIENDIGDSRQLGVTGDHDCGCWNGSLQLSIDREDAVDSARLQEAGVLRDEILMGTVVGGKEEVPCPHEEISWSAENLGVVTLA